MAYIGNTADQQAFTPAVDFFSGNGSTVAFTLSRPVASVAQVQATIENVPQNPGTAFTVSGNTITFDGAPASGTNNIYVYYTSPITQVIQPGQGTVGTAQMASGVTVPFGLGSAAAPSIAFTGDSNTGIFSPGADSIGFAEGGAEVARFDSSGNFGVGTTSPDRPVHLKSSGNRNYFKSETTTSSNANESGFQVTTPSSNFLFGSLGATNKLFIYDVNATAERFAIDSSGRVTMPFQPAFLVGSSLGDTTISAGNVVAFDTVSFNTGSNFSTGTGRFTAPVAGRYQFNFLAYFTSSGGNTQSMQIAPYLNGSQIMVGGDAILFVANTPNVTSIICIGGSVTLNLAANDYVTANARGTNARLYMGHTKFSGYLLG